MLMEKCLTTSSITGNNHPGPKIEPEEPALPVVPEVVEARTLDETEERFRLDQALQSIETLNLRIHNLQKTEQRLRKQVREEKERLKNSKADAEGALSLLVMAEEKIYEVEGVMAFLKQDVDRYRRWWLTEYYSLKAVLAMLPQGSWDDVGHIAEAAHARFATFSTRA